MAMQSRIQLPNRTQMHNSSNSLHASALSSRGSSPCLSQMLHFCLPISEQDGNMRLRGIKMLDNTVFFVVYDFINILLGVEFETTNTRKIFLRVQDKLADTDVQYKMFNLQFCGLRSHDYPCMSLQNLYRFKHQCVSARTNDIDVNVESFFSKIILLGFDLFLESSVHNNSNFESNFESIVRANLYVCIDQIARDEEDNFQPNINYVQINGLFCNDEYFFNLDECLVFLKAYAKDSFKGRKYCQKLRSHKYKISQEYEKYLEVAVQPLNDVLTFQSSSSYASVHNLLQIIESAEFHFHMKSRCNHKDVLKMALEKIISGQIHFV